MELISIHEKKQSESPRRSSGKNSLHSQSAAHSLHGQAYIKKPGMRKHPGWKNHRNYPVPEKVRKPELPPSDLPITIVFRIL